MDLCTLDQLIPYYLILQADYVPSLFNICRREQKKKKLCGSTDTVDWYDQKGIFLYKGVGWSKCGDFERTYYLNGPLIKFYNSDHGLL